MCTRLFVSAPLGNGREIELTGERARYLGRVLRLAIGAPVVVFNGEDGEWRAHIAAMTKTTVTLLVDAASVSHTESALKTHLVQGISRGERMDFVVQKATELGVKRISPVLTDHGMVRLDDQRALKRQQHWQRIAESACEQCGRIRPPLIDAPIPLNQWFGAGSAAGSTQIILQAQAAAALTSIDASDAKICLLIGPEGGFSEREYQDARVAGFTAAALGPRILRTETAALAAITILQAKFGDL